METETMMRAIGFMLLLIISSACGQSDAGKGMVLTGVPSPDPHTPSATVDPVLDGMTAVAIMPNLRVISAHNTYVPTHCMQPNVSKHMVWIDIINDGGRAVDAFYVRLNDEDISVDGLHINEVKRLEVPFDGFHQLNIEIDPMNQVYESDETDNMLQAPVMTFTPPPQCTPIVTTTPP